MRNFRFWGIAALTLAITFGFTACDDNLGGGKAPLITTTSLQEGTVGTAYSQTLEATGDTPITWSIEVGGSLPDGLTLDETSGVISGEPTTKETKSFTVKATNAAGYNTKGLSIKINGDGDDNGDDDGDGDTDTTAPTLSNGGLVSERTSHTSVTIRFTTDEAGTAYYLVKSAGDAAPTKAEVKAGTSLGAVSSGVNDNVSITLTAGAKDIYVVVADAAGNISDPLKIAVTAYVPPLASLEWTGIPAGTTAGTSTFGTNDIYGIAYGADKFVAVGEDNVMAYSTNGTSWTSTTAASIFGYEDINDIAYGADKFVAVGGGAKMASSTNGTSWTAVTTNEFGTADIKGIAYGSNGSTVNTFVIVGVNGKMAYFANGTSWTAVTTSQFGSTTINGIAYGGDKFVAVGGGAKMAYSTNGTSWTPITTSTFGSTTINRIAYGNGKFVAVGESGKMAYSADGITWTAVAGGTTAGTSTFGTIIIKDIAYGGGRFVAVGNSGRMAHSTDGITWTAILGTGAGSSTFGDTGQSYINGITYGGGRFVAGGGYGKMAYSNLQE